MMTNIERNPPQGGRSFVAFANHSPLPAPGYRPIADENWMAAWKDHYHPIPIVRNCWFVPAWLSNPETSRLAVKIDPSMAFGTGTHPSTQLCLELVEEYVQSGKVVD